MLDQLRAWQDRSVITANLLNPAFCGEVLRRTIESYNLKSSNKFPFALAYLILPLVLHKGTREKMPLRSTTYFHSWVEENEHLLLEFPQRLISLKPYTKEALMFLLNHGSAAINDNGSIEVAPYRRKSLTGSGTEEVKEIFRKAELLGKWMSLTGNQQTIFMFLKIRP
ncbi:three component ABC system middle component [Pontibacter mangrovi]|uniref:Uncharacterized protein n=1 Tax=Pontibacter mangrovi TaxID=2589816 RepID=A0A501W9C5_9BACT|nr:three component ABC system middle component [Pontibacter mangrovi]TPE42166.1 hypothetical protein FJM65_18980 [Pontibacter mangrovi]